MEGPLLPSSTRASSHIHPECISSCTTGGAPPYLSLPAVFFRFQQTRSAAALRCKAAGGLNSLVAQAYQTSVPAPMKAGFQPNTPNQPSAGRELLPPKLPQNETKSFKHFHLQNHRLELKSQSQ